MTFSNESVTCRGGARIGFVNATWPFAHLSADREKLRLDVAVLGDFPFESREVVALEPFCWIPMFAWGIRIRHAVPAYPEVMRFWCLGSPWALEQEIRGTGFRAGASEGEAAMIDRSMAWRWQFLAACFVGLNALMSLEPSHRNGAPPGPATLLSMALIFFLAMGIRHDTWVRHVALKPGRTPGEVRQWTGLLALTSGILLVIFALISL